MQVLLWLTLAATLLQACCAENCGGGVDGLLNDAQTACCPKSCKKCATKGCANRKGGSKRCCPNRVAKQPRCSKKKSPAPCRPALFNIVLVPVPGTDPKYTKYFTQAKERWESIITHDLVGYGNAPPGGWFQDGPAYTEPVDDLVIAYSVEKIDGEGNVLGTAGPLHERNDPVSRKRGEANLPLSGTMQFDIADAARLVKAGVFQSVVLHEMGHVLGIGSLWPTRKSNCGFYTRGKKKGQPPTCSTYTAKADGTCAAQVEFSKLDLGRGKRLKMETKGGQGTACLHWSEDQLCNELMTGTLDSYKRKPPLSKITIAALKDLGYKVDYSQADKFTLRCPQRAALRDMYALTGEPYGVMLPTTPVVFSGALNATATLVDETWW